MGTATALDALQSGEMDFNFFTINNQSGSGSPFETPSGAVSKLDLKAPGKARAEYTKGYQLLMRRDAQGAVPHLVKAIALYSDYVAAHNTLGSAYLSLGQNEKARDEFATSAVLDDHLPNSFLNLGCAQLALKNYPEAEDAFHKASALAPLDSKVQLALAYGQFVNHDYAGVVETAKQVHEHKHQGAALVHYFAAGAWDAQNNPKNAEEELRILLKEDPKSPSADQFRAILQEIKSEDRWREQAKLHPARVNYTIGVPITPPEQAGQFAQLAFQDIEEKEQISDAEAEPSPNCDDCAATPAESPEANPGIVSERSNGKFAGPVFRSSVDEVSILFAATDRGRSVTNLTRDDIGLRDNSQPPSAILGFRNESELPLRLGLVIDTSNSITSRFRFELEAAGKFLQKIVTNRDDLSFVIGVNNSVLLVQDFTGDQMLTSHAISQLAPGGGTALWDAVAYASDKLAKRPEIQPVARILVVISDGEDNSSSLTLKQAMARAQRSEVAVYTVSTREMDDESESAILGDHALRALSELTGGAAFAPGSVRRLDSGFADLQQVIRSRYLVSYKPALFERNGRYRPISITAEKGGHKLRVYARKGYYASTAQPPPGRPESGVTQ